MSEIRCPSCGRRLKMIPLAPDAPGSTWGPWSDMASYRFEVPGGHGSVTEYQRETPARAATFQSEVLVPLAQSCISGAIVSGLVLIGCYNRGWDLLFIPLSFGAVTLFFWAILLMDARKLLRKVEVIFRGDDTPQEPQAPAPPQRLEVEITERQPGGGSMRFLDLPISEKALRSWARDVAIKGESLTVPRWTGAGGPFTQSEYTTMMVQLESRGLAVNYGGSRGRVLTAAGRGLLKTLAQ